MRIEHASGAIDGVNKVFTTSADYRVGAISVYVNGLQCIEAVATGGSVVTLPSAPLVGDTVVAKYSPECPCLMERV